MISHNFEVHDKIDPSFSILRGKRRLILEHFVPCISYNVTWYNMSVCILDCNLKVLQTSATSKEEYFNNPFNISSVMQPKIILYY